MQNKRYGSDRDNRRSSNQRSYSAEDSKRRFQDQNYDRYFPQQNAYHPRNEDSQSQQQYGSQFQQRDQTHRQYGESQSDLQRNYRNQNYSDTNKDYGTSDYGSSFGTSDLGSGYGTGYGRGSFSQGSSQSWSQPVRNDEVPQTGRSFYGKGPKNFKRSDERIREEVSEALFHDHAVDASEIEVQVNDGEVTLTGTVSERQMKRQAEDCAESISGVKDVRNEIRVQASSFADRSEKTGSLPNTDESTSSDRLPSSSFENSKSKSPNKLM